MSTPFGTTVKDTARLCWRYGRMYLAGSRPRRTASNVPAGKSLGKQVLLFVRAFPPDFTAGVFRTASLAHYFVENGWNVTVVSQTPRHPLEMRGMELRNRISSRINVVHYDRDLRPFSRLTPQVNGGLETAFAALSRAEGLLPKDVPTIVFASGPPFSSFLAATVLARSRGIPLVLDYRDEWTRSPFSFVKTGRLDRAWEPRCLRTADRIVMTTQSQIDHLLESFPEVVPQRCVLVPNGWEPNEFASAAAIKHTRAAPPRCTISFVGSLGDHTLPGRFLATLGMLLCRRRDLVQSLRVQFIGSKSTQALAQIEAFPHQQVLRMIDPVGKIEAVRAMQESPSLLILNEPRLHRYLPGKLCDYLAARRPILVYGDGGEVAKLVRQLHAGLVVSLDDDRALEAALDTLFQRPQPVAEHVHLESWLARHTRGELARRYSDILDDLILGAR